MVSVDANVTRIYTRNRWSEKYIVINRGGTRSSKTYSLCQLALFWLINPASPGEYWSIIRKTLPALKATAYRDFQELIATYDLGKLIHHNRSDFIFSYGNRKVEFFSLDDEHKIRSRKRDFLHICEANELNYDAFIQLQIRTKMKIYLDLNPSDSGSNNWILNEIERKRIKEKGDVDIVVSTYKDNPFLTQREVENIEYIKTIDEELWNVFGLGEWGKVTGIIFKDFELEDIYPINDIRQDYIGIDFGFSIDQCAIIRVGKRGSHIYIHELLYRTKMTNHDISDYLHSHNFDNILCIADSAEPKSIEELRREGIRVIPSVKGRDSVYQGIMQMKKYKLHVTKSSANTIRELNNYKWDKNKADTPIDAFNHTIDAARYVVQTKFKGQNNVEVSGAISNYRNVMVR